MYYDQRRHIKKIVKLGGSTEHLITYDGFRS